MENKEDWHLLSREIECEKCGGEVKIINFTYPNAYECVCKKCGHRFTWIRTEEER